MFALKNVTAGKILKEMSLAIRPKECVCIEGSDAAELSMLFRILATLEKPTSGTVEVDNVDMAALPPAVLQLFRSRLGLVFHPPMFIEHLTVGQNVALPLHLRGMRPDVITKAADDLLKRLGLTQKAGLLPSSVEEEDKQLMCLARCLITAPLVIIGLEPFQGLSDKHAYEAAMLFQNLRKKGATVVFLSRDQRTAALMGVHPTNLSDGTLRVAATATASHVEIPSEETEPSPAPAIKTEEGEEMIPVTHRTPSPAATKPSEGSAEGRKIRITPIGSGLA